MSEKGPGCVDSPLGTREELADLALQALNASLQETAPPCDGRALFTADRLTDEERALCASICAACPVADLCGAYATAVRVTFGFWGGHPYTPKGKTTAPGGSREL